VQGQLDLLGCSSPQVPELLLTELQFEFEFLDPADGLVELALVVSDQ
jgi:hypothetical protein